PRKCSDACAISVARWLGRNRRGERRAAPAPFGAVLRGRPGPAGRPAGFVRFGWGGAPAGGGGAVGRRGAGGGGLLVGGGRWRWHRTRSTIGGSQLCRSRGADAPARWPGAAREGIGSPARGLRVCARTAQNLVGLDRRPLVSIRLQP